VPRVGGIEVLEAIRSNERTKRIPVVVMTSSEEARDLDTTYGLGINSYVVKPFDFNTFTARVRQAGYYWLIINRTPA
jgi:CheY-like chemotaxis protein